MCVARGSDLPAQRELTSRFHPGRVELTRQAQDRQGWVVAGFLDGGCLEDFADHRHRGRAHPGCPGPNPGPVPGLSTASLGQVRVVRLILIQRACRQQQMAGQALISPIDLQHGVRDAKVNERADVAERDGIEVPRPDHVCVLVHLAPVRPRADLERCRWQRLHERLLLGGEDAQPGPGAFLERLPVIGIDLLIDPDAQLCQGRELLVPEARDDPGRDVGDRVLNARFVFRSPNSAR